MTLTMAQLRERVAAHFPNIEQVDDSIIRFTRALAGNPFAVFYLDIKDDLPTTEDILTRYQDRVIGARYFSGRKSLQWNNYLYFITSSDRLRAADTLRAKDLIEKDRRYARKFVITPDELDSVLSPEIKTPAEAHTQVNILARWIERLAEAGLEKAVLNDEDLPSRLSLIESSSAEPKARPRVLPRRAHLGVPPFIQALHLKKFRAYPLQKDFDFGAVNLIFGPNASGKTSLLEAIELYYCGRTKRNPDARSSYDFSVTLADGKIEHATPGRQLQVFRDRNLAWYGQSEVLTTAMYRSFARFNFLDTDAAVRLSESPENIEEDLSRLLVGPDASKTWRDVERVHEALTSRLQELRPLEKQIREELAFLNARLTQESAATLESDVLRVRLEQMMQRLAWPIAEEGSESLASRLVGGVSEVVSVAQQAAAMDWTDSPRSVSGLRRYIAGAKSSIDAFASDVSTLGTAVQGQKQLTVDMDRCRGAASIVREIKKHLDAGVPERVAARIRYEQSIAVLNGLLAGLDADGVSQTVSAPDNTSVEIHLEESRAALSAAREALANAQHEYAAFTRLRDQSAALAQQLRQIAAKILEHSTEPDECPLCHTRFEPNGLAKHMGMGVDQHLETAGQRLLGNLGECERSVSRAQSEQILVEKLASFCQRADLAPGVPIGTVFQKIDETRKSLYEEQKLLESVGAELASLESQGLSAPALQALSQKLQRTGYSPVPQSPEEADRLLTVLAGEERRASEGLTSESKRVLQIQGRLMTALRPDDDSFESIQAAFSHLSERLVQTERLTSRIDEIKTSYPWPDEKALGELAVEATAIRNVATELQAALNKEKQLKSEQAAILQRKQIRQEQLDKTVPRLSRFSQAESVLNSLMREMPLEGAMETALNDNRRAVESIFSRIHAPQEFSGLGSTVTALKRKSDGKEATLSEISTGQRAAFGLSIFLAQNAQLRTAPPVILIDDPIAHVDDLNCLSFLDYLREIAVTGERQIFFATASDKIAVLFERKFDFLGPAFKRFNLGRELSTATSLRS